MPPPPSCQRVKRRTSKPPGGNPDKLDSTPSTEDRTMSILVRYTPTAVTTQQYDESIRRITATGDWPPDGLEYHVAFGPDANLRVSEIWDSREQWEEFGKRLMPLLTEIGIEPGEPELLAIHNIVKR
jgi:hypothetical protein